MKIPTTLKHKPVIVSENYERVDDRGLLPRGLPLPQAV